MEPANKRPRLAPKLNASVFPPPDPHSAPYHHKPSQPPHEVLDAPRHSQRQGLEAYACHLHDAAILIGRQARQPTTSYTDVSVLLLGWQDDSAAIENIRALQQVLITDYRYHTQTWQIPTVANPTVQLSMQMASFLEHVRPNQLLIIYYSGHGYAGPDGQLYWACSPQAHSAKLRWDGVRCLFQDSQSDILLLSDTCAVPDPITPSHSLKQVIAACSPENARHPSAASRAYFSPCFVAALHHLSRNSPFSAEQLWNEIKIVFQARSDSWSRFPSPPPEPKFFTMTPKEGRNIEIAPSKQSSPAAHWPTPGYTVKAEQSDGQTSPTARLYQSLAATGLAIKPITHGADSVEMQEAAEQLKAPGQVRHRSGDAANTSPQRAALPARMLPLHPGFHHMSRSESVPVLEGGTGSTAAWLKRILGKPDNQCDLCSHAPFKDPSSLRKHIAAAHTRPFLCAFYFAGCTSTFGSKNEWKRHITSQHLRLQYYRCSACSQPTVDGKGNEFNRKDLFTQHLRRMHANVQVKRPIAKGDDGQEGSEWESYVQQMQQRCLIQRRHPPQRSNCPKPNCVYTFEGRTTWDEWTEHVGWHMEKGEGDNLGVDVLLLQYALDEGIVKHVSENEYRLVEILGSGGAPS